jgi:hypothetical protein
MLELRPVLEVASRNPLSDEVGITMDGSSDVTGPAVAAVATTDHGHMLSDNVASLSGRRTDKTCIQYRL